MPLSLISSETEVDSDREFQLILEVFTMNLIMVRACDNHSPTDSPDGDGTALFPEYVSGSVQNDHFFMFALLNLIGHAS